MKLVRDGFGCPFAAKILTNLNADMRARVQDSIQNEVKNLKHLNHPNILHLIEFKKNGVYTKRDSSQKTVSYILLEVCPNGSLFNYVFTNGCMEESLARFYFKQLLSAVESCHAAGICHRDIKPRHPAGPQPESEALRLRILNRNKKAPHRPFRQRGGHAGLHGPRNPLARCVQRRKCGYLLLGGGPVHYAGLQSALPESQHVGPLLFAAGEQRGELLGVLRQEESAGTFH